MEDAKKELKLLGMWASPFVYRVQIALNLKGISYEYIEQDLRNKSQLLLDSNPIHKKVPVLIHDSKTICESSVILEYIDEVWPSTALLSSNPYARAMARFWASYIDDKFFPSLREILKATTEEAKKEATNQTWSSLELLEETCFKENLFIGGDSISFLDIVLGSHIGWIKTLEKMTGVKLLHETKFPLLVEWEKRFCSADCVKGVIADVDKLEVFGKVLQEMWKSSDVAK